MPPPPPAPSASPSGSPPASVKMAVQVIYGLIGLSLLNLVLTIAMRDSLIEAWAEASPGNRQLFEQGGVDAVADNAPAFVPIAIISFVFFGLVYLLLGAKLAQGAGWARIVLTVLSALALLGVPLAFAQSNPVLFTLLSVVQGVAYAALLYFVWQRDTSAHIAAT